MDLELNDDQAELRAIARQLLDERGDLRLARELLEGRGDGSALCEEIAGLGWFGVGLEPDDGFGLPGLCVLAEQVGAHVAPVPLVDSAVLARLAGAAEDESLRQAAAGGAVGALCAIEPASGWNLNRIASSAVRLPDGGIAITTTKLGVHHAARAQLFAVLAELDGEPVALLFEAGAGGCEVRETGGLDPSAVAGTVKLDGLEVSEGACVRGQALRDAIAVGTVATAAEAVGAASRALEMAVQYALERKQFGKPIGSFQALQHRLADMYVLRETAWSTVLFAAAALDEGLQEAGQAVSIAKIHASRAARSVVEGALQVFGGIGFTWEHDSHLLQRRVLECERRYGDEIDHERALAELII
jgi:alkylation response protein AidB-like acyl-CoA dehydrogenase